MSKSTIRKKLVCFVAHSAHLESCLPLLDRVAHRGKVDVELHLNRSMLQIFPELADFFASSQIKVVIDSRVRIELFSYFDMKRADAILSYGDPIAFRNKFRLRDFYLVRSGKPSIFIQHGLIQEGVNRDSPMLKKHWYASLILWWTEAKKSESLFITDETREKIKVVGFLKKRVLPIKQSAPEVLDLISRHKKTILICTAIPVNNYRFSEAALRDLFQMLDQFCKRNPEYLVLLRSHRARKASMGVDLAETALQSHSNLVVMDRHSGPFAGSTIHDCLPLCDVVVGHASTAILDAIFANKPSAVLQNDSSDLEDLPQINNIDALEAFVRDSKVSVALDNQIRRRFGDLERNLDSAAKHVEDLIFLSIYRSTLKE